MSALYVIATPIGNLEDLTPRARRVLGEVDALACEDTRVTRRLFERFGIPSPKVIFSSHEHNEARAARRILDLLKEGRSVGLCSNAGYPAISDPGYRAVSAAIEAGFPVEVLPGAGAVEPALVLSGLPSSSFTFKGFPPKKSGKRRAFLAEERDRPHTLVLFESPHRVAALLEDALAVLGDRRAAVCLELTKKFERVRRGFLSELVPLFTGEKIKGEATVVIAGHHEKFMREEPLVAHQQCLPDRGHSKYNVDEQP
ncbi:MAG: 16S rRNA (cytidine(1402)-2'-O)-methyltransferase [Planctomycetota bacterium]